MIGDLSCHFLPLTLFLLSLVFFWEWPGGGKGSPRAAGGLCEVAEDGEREKGLYIISP